MATVERPPVPPVLGDAAEVCTACGAPLRPDQRYCLECGARRAAPRVDFREVLTAPAADAAAPPPVPPPATGGAMREMSAGTAALGVALAVLFLGVGVLVGRSGSEAPKTAAAPSVVTVGQGGGSTRTASAGAAGAGFKSDWPAKESGWTVQLAALPKASADPAKVAAAKSEATGKGVPDVGALDSDRFGSLPPGRYVVYSGRFKTRADATKALGKARKSYPKAKVVRVTAAGAGPVIDSAAARAAKKRLDALQNLSGADYSRQSRKLPKTLPLPGRAPPTDNRQGGGGSGFDTIE